MKSECYENFARDPYFKMWLLLGIMHFEVLRDMLGSGGAWDEGGSWLV